MHLVIASSFLEGALFSMLLPCVTVIALVTWYARSVRRMKDPIGPRPGASVVVQEPADPGVPRTRPEGVDPLA